MPTYPPFFVTNAQVALLEDLCSVATGLARTRHLVELAWHHRQRNSVRAMLLVEEADAALTLVHDENESPYLRARLLLVRIEVVALRGEFSLAADQLAELDKMRLAYPDSVLSGDRFLAEALLRTELGERSREFECFQAALEAYSVAGDTARRTLAEAFILARTAVGSSEATLMQAQALRSTFDEADNPGAAVLLQTVEFRTELTANPGRSVLLASAICEAAHDIGMLRLCIVFHFNGSVPLLGLLGDLDGAALHIEKAERLAAAAGWPAYVALAKLQLGNLLRNIGDVDRARALIEDSIRLFPRTTANLNELLAWLDWARLLVDCEEFEQAEMALDDLIPRLRSVQEDFLGIPLVLRARVLAATGDSEGAIVALKDAASFYGKQIRPIEMIDLYRALSELYKLNSIRTSEIPVGWPSSSVDALESALRMGQGTPGWKPDVSLLLELKSAWSDAAEPSRALQYSEMAFEREREISKEHTAGRIAYIRERNDLDRARAEAEHHREIAAASAEMSETLTRIGRVGRELTAKLKVGEIVDSLDESFRSLLEAASMSMHLVEPKSGTTITLLPTSSLEAASNAAAPCVAELDEAVAKCIQSGGELLLTDEYSEQGGQSVNGDGKGCLLISPLVVGTRVLGVLALRALGDHIYDESEMLIVRSICSFGAIAIDNAMAYALLEEEEKKSDRLLKNILPTDVANELRMTGASAPRRYDDVSVLFTDFSNFTTTVSALPAARLVNELNGIFQVFDEILDRHGVEKIKTIGDAYMAVAGLPEVSSDHAERCVEAAFEMLSFIADRNISSAIKWEMRAGIHSGAVVAGIVGKRKFAYDVFGDTVNIASRMESGGAVGRINVSAYTFDLVKHRYRAEYRGKLDVKGKGAIDMYFIER